MVTILFWILVLPCCAYTAWRGGRDGRLAASAILVATFATVPATLAFPTWASTHYPVFLVDTFLLIALYAICIHSRRYWPMWMTAFHLITVTTHIATIAAPNTTPKLYQAMGTIWVVPVLLSMVVGVMQDHRSGARYASD